MAGEAIRFNASLNTAGFDSGAKNLQNLAAQASAGITRHFGKIAAAVVGIGAAFIGVRAAVQSFNAAIAMGGQLNDLSARTGETAGNLAILQRAFENAGAGAEAVGPTINRLQRAIVEAGEGGKEQAKAFEKLGMNLEDIRRKTPTEQLQAVAAALQRVGNDSDRSAIAMQLLGRSGGELLPLLRAMGVELDAARNQLGSLPGVMDRTNRALDTIGDNFAAIAQKGKEFAAGLLEKVAPALADLTTRLANIDAAGFGAKLSEYAEATGRWIAETFKLGDALNNIEIAIKGITSGNFGSGLSLMFSTARDTAFNAINEIVAMAMAALKTVGSAIADIFGGNSPIRSLAGTLFEYLGNKIEEISLRTIRRSLQAAGLISDAVRESMIAAEWQAQQSGKAIAEKLSQDTRDSVSFIGDLFAEAPKKFGESYRRYAANPLIEMAERTKETADQAARLEQQTRAAAFSAKSYADEMSRAREEMLAGGAILPPSSAPTLGTNDKGFKFPWQGTGMSGASMAAASAAPLTSGGSIRGGSAKPKTPFDNLRFAAETDPNARAALMRLQNEEAKMMSRAGDLRERGAFGSSAREEMRAERRSQARASREMQRQAMRDMFNASNVGDAVRNFTDEARAAGMTFDEAMSRMGGDRKVGESQAAAMDRLVKELSKTEAQRKEDAKAGSGGAGADRAASDAATETTLRQLVSEIKQRLPQNALS